jgi:hypothetical protein
MNSKSRNLKSGRRRSRQQTQQVDSEHFSLINPNPEDNDQDSHYDHIFDSIQHGSALISKSNLQGCVISIKLTCFFMF